MTTKLLVAYLIFGVLVVPLVDVYTDFFHQPPSTSNKERAIVMQTCSCEDME